MKRRDKILKCASCNQEFLFAVGEQEFFANHGYQEPKHCKSCIAMRAGHPEPEKTTIICDDCGKEDTVPFRPLLGRPVFCRDCFRIRRAESAA